MGRNVCVPCAPTSTGLVHVEHAPPGVLCCRVTDGDTARAILLASDLMTTDETRAMTRAAAEASSHLSADEQACCPCRQKSEKSLDLRDKLAVVSPNATLE